MNELAIMPRNLAEVGDVAAHLAKSKIGLPPSLIGREPEIYMIIMAGLELGMPPMAALRSFHLIEVPNQPVIPRLSADAMVAIVMASGKAEYVRKVGEDKERCTWETKRIGHTEPIRSSWSMLEQRAIGWKDYSNWAKYPQRMMSARAKSFLMRDVYPDVLGGMYSVEEMEDPVDAVVTITGVGSDPAMSTGAVIDAVFTDSPPPPPAPVPVNVEAPEAYLIRNALADAESNDSIDTILAGVPAEIVAPMLAIVLLRRIAVARDLAELRKRVKPLIRAAPPEVIAECRGPFGEREAELTRKAAEVSNGG